MSPEASETDAANPNRSRARDVSSARRGCPSGLSGSQRVSPLKPVASAISRTSSRIAIS